MKKSKQAEHTDSLYLNEGDPELIADINRRKEFVSLRDSRGNSDESGVVPYFMLRDHLAKGRYLRFKSYQLFVGNLMTPDTPYSRLFVMHDMGTGKTLTAIGVAMRFIEVYKMNPRRLQLDRPKEFVYVIGYTRGQFEADLFKFTELGFITRFEQEYLTKLRHHANLGAEADIKTYKEYYNRLRRRLSNLKGNGFFKFIGYRELANHVFMGDVDVANMKESEITRGLEAGTIAINMAYVEQFRNCLLIVDEVHNVYNSLAKNNWGVAIQIILNTFGPDVRGLFLSGTILKNSQTEIVDVLNLAIGSRKKIYTRSEFFTQSGDLIPGALGKITELMAGHVSFLVDINPERYPKSIFIGEMIRDAKYLKFERCAMGRIQRATYDTVAHDPATLHEHSYIFDMVFPSEGRAPATANSRADSESTSLSLEQSTAQPTSLGTSPGTSSGTSSGNLLGIFKSSGIRQLETSSPKWRTSLGLSVNTKEKTIYGSFLQRDKMADYSGKYPRMIDILGEIMANRKGKVFIYHKFVHMTGVFLIGHILEANGIIPLNAPANDDTRCVLCSVTKKSHPSPADHDYTPARFAIVHGELDKRTMLQLLDKFNDRDNLDGRELLILIGSRVMREGYNLIACRHVFIISRPDNIPSLLQITARAIRAGSHVALPPESRDVSIRIFTASIGDNTLSYEEDMYIRKIHDYEIIQHIERAIHAGAIDAEINRRLIAPGLVHDSLGHLYFEAANLSALTTTDLNLGTFNIFYKEREVADIIYIVKRLFMEWSRVWQRDDLWKAVRAPSFEFEYDTSLFAPENFAIAMHRLVWDNDFFGDLSSRNESVFDVLWNPGDKHILLNGQSIGVIVQMNDFYIAFAYDQRTHLPDIVADAPYRTAVPEIARSYSIISYIKTSLSHQRYLDLKASFMAKYKGKPLTEMTDAICAHGRDFHIMLAEEIIAYMFNLWTDPKMIASAEYNAFYFQMLYYYDVMGLIIWMNSAKPMIREIYADYEKTFAINRDSPHEGILPKEYVERNRSDLIHIAREIERAGCSWCPNTVKTRYDAALKKSKLRFAKLKTSTTEATDDIIPVGHMIADAARFYHPDREWFALPEYTKAGIQWKENEIIIGFDLRSESGLHVRFRLRNPRHKIKHHNDARLIERGVICTSRSKPFLFDLVGKLAITGIEKSANLTIICREIRARLLYLELLERAKGSNIKYYYSQFEDGGN